MRSLRCDRQAISAVAWMTAVVLAAGAAVGCGTDAASPGSAPDAGSDASEAATQPGRWKSITDAEYSRSLDRIIFATKSPDQLHIFNPLAMTDVTLRLSAPPDTVSVSPDGRRAAVGGAGSLVIVDLEMAVPSPALPVDDVGDFVLSDAGYVYLMPRKYDLRPLIVIRLSDGENSSSAATLDDGALATIRPQGDFVFTTHRWAGTIDVFSLAAAFSPSMVRGAFDSSHLTCGELWISQDGARLFSACGAVYKVGGDGVLSYFATLAHLKLAASVADAAAAGKVLAITWRTDSPAASLLNIYRADTLELDKVIDLPTTIDDQGRTTNVFPRYVFASADGSRCFVILQSWDGRVETNTFALVSIVL